MYTYICIYIYIYIYIYGDESLKARCPAEKVKKVSRVLQSNPAQAKLINGQRFIWAPTITRLSPLEPNRERNFFDQRRKTFSTSGGIGEKVHSVHTKCLFGHPSDALTTCPMLLATSRTWSSSEEQRWRTWTWVRTHTGQSGLQKCPSMLGRAECCPDWRLFRPPEDRSN